MKIALCFSGQVRDFRLTRRSLQRKILSRLRKHEVYLFAHYPLSGGISPACLGIPFTEVLVEDESKVEAPVPIHATHGVILRSWHQGNPFRAFYLQLRSLYLANWLRQQFEERNGFLFDWVFRLRFDSLFFGEQLESLEDCDPGSIYIPKHDNHYGYNDRFAFGGSQLMDTYSTRFTLFREYEEHGYAMHPEVFLKWALDRNSIRVERTGIACHLLRYGNLYRAYYSEKSGDILTKPRSFFGMLDKRLQVTRFAPFVSRMYLGKVHLLG